MMEITYQKTKPISKELEIEIRDRLYYKDGALYKQKTGARAEYIVKGYLRVWVCGRSLAAHHVVWLLCNGVWPHMQLDHKNQDKADNRIENLRMASNSLNMVNRGLQKNNKSGIKNVSFDKRSGKWRVSVKINTKRHWIGLFASKDDAALAMENFIATRR